MHADDATAKRWWAALCREEAGRAYVVRDAEGRAACATLLVWDHVCAYYLASGIRADAGTGRWTSGAARWSSE